MNPDEVLNPEPERSCDNCRMLSDSNWSKWCILSYESPLNAEETAKKCPFFGYNIDEVKEAIKDFFTTKNTQNHDNRNQNNNKAGTIANSSAPNS